MDVPKPDLLDSDIDDQNIFTASTTTTSKLVMFVICRYEKLSRKDQHILRTASIIGQKFSKDVLYGILSPKMRAHMVSSISSLVTSQWLTDGLLDSASEYGFTHPLLYQTLYDLIPAGDKAHMHYEVATYIEEMHEGDPVHFSQLGLQYSLAIDCKPKALEYYVRAAVHCMVKIPCDYDEGLNLFTLAKQFAEGANDYAAILGAVMDRKDVLSIERLQILRDEVVSERARMQPPRRRGCLPSWIFKTKNALVHIFRISDNEDKDMTFNVGPLTLRQADYIINLLNTLEGQLNQLHDTVVQQEKAEIFAAWQIPFLARRKALMRRDEIRKSFLNLSALSRRMSDPFGESTDHFRRVSSAFARKFSKATISNKRRSLSSSFKEPVPPGTHSTTSAFPVVVNSEYLRRSNSSSIGIRLIAESSKSQPRDSGKSNTKSPVHLDSGIII